MARVFVSRSRQLTEKLRKLREATQAPVRDALAAAGGEIVSMAKRLAPDGPGTGEYDLKSTIRWYFGGELGGATNTTTGRSGSTSVRVVAGDSKNPEATWMEFGTSPHINAGEYAGTVNPGVTPRPYFFPAYRANKAKARRMLNAAIRKAVRDVART